MNQDTLYHLGFGFDHGAKYALMPGDPDRVEVIAARLDNPRFYARKREYTTWLGELEGETVMVISTGMGGPSTAICVEELHLSGMETMIRIGGCGGMSLDVMPGDVIIATGAIRMDGTSREYVPIEFPAVPDFDVTTAMVAGAKAKGITYHTGVVQCKDSFYGQHSPGRMPASVELEAKWQAWIRAGCLGSEMESATLFTVGQYLGMRTGCVLAVMSHQERVKAGLPTERGKSYDDAITVGIEAVRNLILESR